MSEQLNNANLERRREHELAVFMIKCKLEHLKGTLYTSVKDLVEKQIPNHSWVLNNDEINYLLNKISD